MEKIIFEPPITNRGVDNATAPNISQSLETYMLVDWIQFTIFCFEESPYQLFNDIFGISNNEIMYEERGLYSYNRTYYYKNIKMLLNTNRADMGYHFLLSGSACRDIEDLGIDYKDLFKKVLSYGAKFTRIDVSVDIFDNSLFTTDKILECIRNNEVVSKFRNSVEFRKTNLTTHKNNGLTIWFGSRSSDIQIVFYDKLQERLCSDVLVNENVKFWNRLECRFRSAYADTIVANIVDNEDFEKYYFSVINNYINFVNYNANDYTRSRWSTKDWWLKFLNTTDKIKLANINVEKSITSIDKWLSKSVSRSLFMLYLSNYRKDFNNFENYMKYLKKGYTKISPSDLVYINDYRSTLGLDSLESDDLVDIVEHL